MLTTYGLLLMTGLGCSEAWQRKFTRKPKTQPRLSPVINFQDYTQAMTPIDRYRKHYAIFNYWNEELLAALGQSNGNPKRIKQASGESLNELRILHGLVMPDAAASVEPIIAAREKLDRELQNGIAPSSQREWVRRTLDTQTRTIQRTLFWRHVEDQLKPRETAADAQPQQPAEPVADAATP